MISLPEGQDAGPKDRGVQSPKTPSPEKLLPKPGESAVLPRGVNQGNIDAAALNQFPKFEGFKVETGKQTETKTPTATEVRASADQIRQLGHEKIKDAAGRTRFDKDLERFEKLATDRGLDKSEIERTYGQIGRLLKAAGNSSNSQNRLTDLAKDALRILADPLSLSTDKGALAPVVSSQVEALTKHPSATVKSMVDQVLPPGAKLSADQIRQLGHEKIKDVAVRSQFDKDLERFEKLAIDHGLDKSEIERTYGQIGRLLKAGGNSSDSQNRLTNLAKDALRILADPLSLSTDKGALAPVVSSQVEALTKHPSTTVKSMIDQILSSKKLVNQGDIGTIEPIEPFQKR